MRKLEYKKDGQFVTEETRVTPGRRRCARFKRPDGTPRFRGPGRGKKDYGLDGKNPTRAANGGRAD